MKRVIILMSMLLSFAGGMNSAQAQSKWMWPEDKETGQTKWALLSDNLNAKNYAEAVAPFEWLYTNAPDLNKSLYLKGVKLYKALAKAEKDPAKKVAHQQKVMDLYDSRIEYFGEKANVINRKAKDAYTYFKKDEDKYKSTSDLLKQAIDLNGVEVYAYSLVGYFDMLRKVKLTYKEITDEAFIQEYQLVNDLLEQQSKATTNKKIQDDIETKKGQVQTLFVSTIKFTCEKIEENFGEKLKANPDDFKTAKLVFDLLLTYECTKSPLFVTAAETVVKEQPDFGVYKVLGSIALSNKDYAKASEYFNAALALVPEDASKQGDIYMKLAKLASIEGQKSKSRDYAYKAMKADASLSADGYNLIGNLYLSSFDGCSSRVSQVSDRAVYLRAYDMFKKAGNTQMMSKSEAAFPSMEDIFSDAKSIGETISVGCWINEVTTIRKRP